MAYVKAIALALGVALLIGAATAATEAFRSALAALAPGERATVYAIAIAGAVNCSAFFILLFVLTCPPEAGRNLV